MRSIIPLVLLAACGGDGSSSPDAAMPDAAYDTARCLIKGHYGDAGSLTATASMGGITATLDAGPPRDTFYLKMTQGRGVFTGGVMPGTYTIAGADAGYTTCGLCVHIIADIVSGSGPTKFYFADSGTVTLTSTTAPIAGSAMNLHFREVDALGTGAPIAGGCEATIAAISFAMQ